MTADWIVFLSMVIVLKLAWDELKNWQREQNKKLARLRRVNRNYARQIAGEEKR